MATHKSLKVTFWTRTWDLLKGIVLYGSFNWQRASDELKPPRLSPLDRKLAMPTKNPEVIKPRHNPQANLIKTSPSMQERRDLRDITAGAIVSDPSLEEGAPPAPVLPPPPARTVYQPSVGVPPTEIAPGEDVLVIRRRRRHRQGGLQARRAPRSPSQYPDSGKPGLLSWLFGSR